MNYPEEKLKSVEKEINNGIDIANPAETGADTGTTGEIDELTALQNQLNEKTRESEENYERFLRSRADMENMKKRFQREKEDLLRFASRPVVEKLLPVIDDFSRALQAAQNSRDFDGLHQGVEMVHKKLFDILESEGVTAIEALHQPFDPQWHEPLMVEENSDFPDNTVTEEFQKGYMMLGRLIRPSLVKVTRTPASQDKE